MKIEELLAKARWRQEIERRGYEGKVPVASEHLAETLRAELRAILDNGGKPFDLQVARHVYDFAIAAKDLLTVAAKSTDEVMRVIADNNGAMESLMKPDDPPPPEVASETFGARMLRELFALLPTLRKDNEDPLALVAAIADARARGMHDLATRLEQRLIGTPLERPKIMHAEIVHNSYEHGFVDGSMRANFERGTVDGHFALDLQHASPAYREGFEAGRERRQNKTIPASPSVDACSTASAPIDFEQGFADGLSGRDRAHETPAYIEGYVDGVDRGVAQSEPHSFASHTPPHQACERCGKSPSDTIHTNIELFEAPEYSSNGDAS